MTKKDIPNKSYIKIRVRNRWPKSEKKKFQHYVELADEEFYLEDQQPIALNHQSTP